MKIEDLKMEIETLYNEYLTITENRNISYGEIAYIQNLNKKELLKMYNELMESGYLQ